MSEQHKHEMILEGTYPSGAQEWFCPLCERRVLVMNWHPDGKQLVINLGDENSHAVAVTEQDDLSGVNTNSQYQWSNEDGERIEFWNHWLDKLDFQNWWDKPID